MRIHQQLKYCATPGRGFGSVSVYKQPLGTPSSIIQQLVVLAELEFKGGIVFKMKERAPVIIVSCQNCMVDYIVT